MRDNFEAGKIVCYVFYMDLIRKFPWSEGDKKKVMICSTVKKESYFLS